MENIQVAPLVLLEITVYKFILKNKNLLFTTKLQYAIIVNRKKKGTLGER